MGSENLLDKLIRVERTINIYSNKDDELLKEVDIDIIPLEELKKVVHPPKEDPLLYDGYELDKMQLEKINTYLLEKISLNIELYSYVLVCGGVYNWGQE